MTYTMERPDEEPPVVTLDDLYSCLKVMEPFARAHGKGSLAYQVVESVLPELREAGATDLMSPMAPIAVNIAQSNVSWRDWDQLSLGYERLRQELERRLEAAKPKSAIVEEN